MGGNITKRFVSWQEYDVLIHKIADKLKTTTNYEKTTHVYGISRGGLILAVHLSHLLNKPLITELRTGESYYIGNVILVDDISDTGKTLNKYSGFITATLFYKSTSKHKPTVYGEETTDFIVFPWETEQSAKIDCLEE
jgi:hypoxanthine phosphoribosyltransferase